MSDLNLTDALKMAMWLPSDADVQLVEAPSLEQQAEEALREACSASALNATTGEFYGSPSWYRSPAARVLGVLDGTSSSVRARRLNEGEAWGIAARLFERDGATRAEIEGIERQCDLDRVLVLPLHHGDRNAPRSKILRHRDELATALASRAALSRSRRHAPGSSIRTTHRKVHEALAGVGDALGSPGCKWCKRGAQ
jgi:hypothetical protein